MTQQLDQTRTWFEQVVTENYRLFYSIAYRVLQDPAMAEDATQAAMLKGWSRLSILEDRALVIPWLARITRNASLDLLRKKRTDRKYTVPITDEVAQSAAASDSDIAPARPAPSDTMSIFTAELASLPEGMALVVTLRHLQDLTIEEIAERLRMKAHAVRVRLYRAYAKLRENPRIQQVLGKGEQ